MLRELLLCCLIALTLPVEALGKSFAPGSLIISTDQLWQGAGKFKAYGLVYRLLQEGVPLHWIIKNNKFHEEVDLWAMVSELGSILPLILTFQGGPFVVENPDTETALPIVEEWITSHPETTVFISLGDFDADVGRTLRNAPSIALLADGNESIAMEYLKAAGIPDALGNPWSDESPDVFTPEELEGESRAAPHTDGALFDEDGTPQFCQLNSMHWDEGDAAAMPGVIKEVRSFLNHPTHFFAECQAVNAFENSEGGHFLTTGGLVKSQKPVVVSHLAPALPLAQMTGFFETVGGSEPSFGLAEGSVYHQDNGVMIKGLVNPPGETDIWIGGYLDGACVLSEGFCTTGLNLFPGMITYLGGHEYSTDPNSSKSQGLRLFFQSILDAPCARADYQPTVTLTKLAPGEVGDSQVVFTLEYTNVGPGIISQVVVTDPLPFGTTFVEASSGGLLDGDSVTWQLGSLAAGDGGVLTLTVEWDGDGDTLSNVATMDYSVGRTPYNIISNTTDTFMVSCEDGLQNGDEQGVDCGGAFCPPCEGEGGCEQNEDCESGICLDGVCVESGEGKDTDGDGIEDEEDNCPTQANPSQLDGNGDGIGDACEPFVDSDGDGINDENDNCPDGFNPNQTDGDGDLIGDLCDEDLDGDGIANIDDNCSLIPNPGQEDLDEDGQGDACDKDGDGDGVDNEEDNCPDIPNPLQLDGDEDGLGDACGESEADEDGDGIPDESDNCPTIPNPDQKDTDKDGKGDVCDPDGWGENPFNPEDDCPDFLGGNADDEECSPSPDENILCEIGPSGEYLDPRCNVDSDGDGVPDPIDNCPKSVNANQEDLDGNGIGDVCQAGGVNVGGGGCQAGTSGNGPRTSYGWAVLLLLLMALRQRGWLYPSSMMGSALIMMTLVPSPAQGESVSAFGTRYSPFRGDFMALGTLEEPVSGQWGTGVFLDYQHLPFALRRETDGAILRKVVQDHLGIHLTGSVGLTSWMELGLVLPGVLYQSGRGVAPDGELATLGLGDPRLYSRWILYQEEDSLFAMAFTPVVSLPVGEHFDRYMGDSGITFAPTLETRVGSQQVGWSSHWGYRLRERAQLGNLSIGSAYLVRQAVWLSVVDKVLRLWMENSMDIQAQTPFSALNETPIQLTGGLEWSVNSSLRTYVASGGCLTNAVGAPLYRIMGGVRWSPNASLEQREVDTDGDGIADSLDRCVNLPAPHTGDGCPSPDIDNDGICDPWVVATGSVYLFDDLCVGRDACPHIPEDRDRFQDEDGCPDPDNDQDSICDPWVEESGALERYAKVCWRSDRCPNEAETQNGFLDEDGCKDSLRLVRDDIRFEKGEGGLRADGLTAIDEVMTILLAHPNIERLRIRVATSEAPTPQENMALSMERAETLVEYMILFGMDESKLVYEGIGEPSSGAPEQAEFLIEDIRVLDGHAK